MLTEWAHILFTCIMITDTSGGKTIFSNHQLKMWHSSLLQEQSHKKIKNKKQLAFAFVFLHLFEIGTEAWLSALLRPFFSLLFFVCLLKRLYPQIINMYELHFHRWVTLFKNVPVAKNKAGTPQRGGVYLDPVPSCSRWMTWSSNNCFFFN